MTQIGYGPLARIDGPLPIPPLYGLLPAAAASAAGVRIVVDTDEEGRERWIGGTEVYPYPPDLGSIFDSCAPGSATAGQKDFGVDDVAHPQFGAITVYLAETCTSYKVWDQQRFRERAMVAFEAVESAILARHLLTGEGLTLNPYLSDASADLVNPGAATSPSNALALIEKEIGETERFGLVHCSPQMATVLKEHFAIDDRGGVIRTINGNVVVPDSGYTTQVPVQGQAALGATEEVMYATGPIDVRRSEVFVMPDTVDEALDRGVANAATNGRSNTITYRVERYYLLDWDTSLQAAVLVDRCKTTC